MWDVKYRPLKFSDVLGQEGSVQVLKARLTKGTGLDTSYVFSGGHGQGKTTLSRILARALLCQDLQPDGEPCNKCDNCQDVLSESSAAFVEQDAASRGTIENIRAIVEDLPFVIPGAPKRIYLFDEAHRMGTGAQDVLLKPVEDKKMVAIFCTTEPDKIRGPIRSRCEEHAIRRVTREDIFKRMAWVLGQEGVEFEDDAVLTVIDYSNGHVRDVLNRLEMVSQMGAVTLEAVRSHLNLSVITAYYEILLNLGDPKVAVGLVEDACDRVGPSDVAAGLAEAAMNAFRLENGMHVDFSLVDRHLAAKVYAMYGPEITGLADFFLRGYKPSKISLACDVVRFSKQGGKLSGGPVASGSPPVLVSNQSTQTPVQETRPTSTPTSAPTLSSATAVPVAKPPVAPPPVPDKSKSAEPFSDLELRLLGTKPPHPRGCVNGASPIAFEGDGGKQPAVHLTPEQWKVVFEETWIGKRPG